MSHMTCLMSYIHIFFFVVDKVVKLVAGGFGINKATLSSLLAKCFIETLLSKRPNPKLPNSKWPNPKWPNSKWPNPKWPNPKWPNLSGLTLSQEPKYLPLPLH